MTELTFRSELVYHAQVEPEVNVIPRPKIDIGKELQTAVDSIIEYPGSKKGDFGHWVLTEWINAKIQQITERGGIERG